MDNMNEQRMVGGAQKYAWKLKDKKLKFETDDFRFFKKIEIWDSSILKKFNHLKKTQKHCSCLLKAVRPNVELKSSPIFLKVAQKAAKAVFT